MSLENSMIGGSQGHRSFRPHESRLNERRASEAIVSTHARENMRSEGWGGAQTVSRHDIGREGGENERESSFKLTVKQIKTVYELGRL